MEFVYHIKVFADNKAVVIGDGAFIFAVPLDMDGLSLVGVELDVTTVSSSGIVQAQIRDITQTNLDLLTTRVQVDASEFHSKDAATLPVVLATNVLARGDRIAIDVDAAGTGAKGLGTALTFAPGPFVVPASSQPSYADAVASGIAFAFDSETHATPVWTRVDA